MKEDYLKYYEHYGLKGMMRFLWDGLKIQESRKKISLINRQKDYQNLVSKPNLLSLHRKINGYLHDATKEWDHYDYGEGYFYQSCNSIGVTGLRDTEARVKAMELNKLITGKSVLEIGCNTGFLSLLVAKVVDYIVGFDINPYLIKIAKEVASYLELHNIEFNVAAFEEYGSDTKFDVVLSFANHSTYDGNTHQSIEHFFERTHSLTRPHGMLIFESHPPEFEGDGLENVCKIIEKMFTIEKREVLKYGGFLDSGRTFIIGQRRD